VSFCGLPTLVLSLFTGGFLAALTPSLQLLGSAADGFIGRAFRAQTAFFEQTRVSPRLITMQKLLKIFVAKAISFVTFAHSFDR